jgi:hypothetical protein
MTKIWRNTAEKIAIYLSLGLHKGHPRYRRSLQPLKENSQHIKKNLLTFSIFVGHFCLLDSNPDQQHWIDLLLTVTSRPGLDPEMQKCHTWTGKCTSSMFRRDVCSLWMAEDFTWNFDVRNYRVLRGNLKGILNFIIMNLSHVVLNV